MVAEETPPKVDAESIEEEKRVEWNRARFEDLGFQSELAELLTEAKADWHDAESIVAKGGTLNDCLRILL